MKKLLFFVLSMIVISVHAQSADEVIGKYTANMGGLDAFNKITSAKITGTFNTQGMDFPLTQQLINRKAFRTDVEVTGKSMVSCYNNGKGWKLNPFQDKNTPAVVTGTELNDFKSQSNLASSLMDYKARGHKVLLLGEEDIEGIKTYKIKLTSKDDGRITTYFISTKDYTLIKSVTVINSPKGQDMEIETWYSDLEETGGVKFFMTITSRTDGQTFQEIKLKKIELNVPIDEKIFQMK